MEHIFDDYDDGPELRPVITWQVQPYMLPVSVCESTECQRTANERYSMVSVSHGLHDGHCDICTRR